MAHPGPGEPDNRAGHHGPGPGSHRPWPGADRRPGGGAPVERHAPLQPGREFPGWAAGPGGSGRRPAAEDTAPFVRRGAPFRQARPPYEPTEAAAPGDLLGEDEELVAGRRPVEEAFLARRDARRLLVAPQRRQALEKLVLHATNLRIPIVEVEGGTLSSLAGFDGHQGVALVTDRRRFVDPDAILARAIERHEPAFVLVLDSLEDPQNFGSLLRTAEASGVHGVIYPTHRQAPLSPAAVKASAGAVEHLLLAPVDDLAEALTDLHIRGLRIVGTDSEAPLTARGTDLRGPVVIVVGSEGQGLGPSVRRRCDSVVRIPMHGHVGSLNAAVAGSILLYEAASQRNLDTSPAFVGRGEVELGSLPEPAETGAGKSQAPAEASTGDARPASAPAEAPTGDARPAATATGRPAPRPRRRAMPKAESPSDEPATRSGTNTAGLLPGGPSPAASGDQEAGPDGPLESGGR